MFSIVQAKESFLVKLILVRVSQIIIYGIVEFSQIFQKIFTLKKNIFL